MQFTDLETWMLDNADMRIFRVWKYKKVFTPLEQEKKYCDQGVYENETADFMWLEEVVELDNGRVMFGFKDAYLAAEYDHGDIDFTPPIVYMMDGEFAMEHYPDDIKRVMEELGYSEDVDEDSEATNAD